MEAGIRGRLQPGPAADLGAGEAAGPRAVGDSGTTAMVARSVEKFGSPELKDEVMPRVFSGHVRLCLGYTEPEGGSDVATCKTRAVRDGDGWVINGSKMFTTGAHNCQYVFLITNTDPQCAEAQEPDHVPGAAGLAGHRDPGHPHRRRRPHQHRLLQRRPRRRQVPARRGERRLDGAARAAQRRARRGRSRAPTDCRTCRS